MRRRELILTELLKEKKLTIAVAESVTCGFIAHKLATVIDTSTVFAGSIVCYHEDVKKDLLKIKSQLIKTFTAESQEVTSELAKNLKKLIKADIYAAVTGLAAQGGSETKQKPVGTIFFSVIYKGKLTEARRLFKGTPLDIKKKAANEMFSIIIKLLKQ